MSFQYTAVYVPTGQVFQRKQEFPSREEFYKKVNDWNRIATLAPKVHWLYYW